MTVREPAILGLDLRIGIGVERALEVRHHEHPAGEDEQLGSPGGVEITGHPRHRRRLEKVIAIAANPISDVPDCAASIADFPRSRWRKMFSVTTIAS